jgi:Domain of unknown function (DUF4440)
MKQCISFCLLFFVGTFTCLAQSKDADIKSLTHLREVEWPQAYKTQDTTLLNKILASEFQGIDAAGIVTNKQRELNYIKKHKPDYSSFQFTVIRLDIFENGSAIVAGTGTVKGIGKEGNYVMTYQSSNFFVKRDNRWQAVGAHISGVSRVALN